MPNVTNGMPISKAAAYGLGWLSIGLGLVELLSPKQVANATGAPAPNWLVRGYGLREIGAGVAILSSNTPNRMVWTRVAGDLLDLATLLPGTTRPESAGKATGSILSAVMITALDALVAMQEPPSAGRPDLSRA